MYYNKGKQKINYPDEIFGGGFSIASNLPDDAKSCSITLLYKFKNSLANDF